MHGFLANSNGQLAHSNGPKVVLKVCTVIASSAMTIKFGNQVFANCYCQLLVIAHFQSSRTAAPSPMTASNIACFLDHDFAKDALLPQQNRLQSHQFQQAAKTMR